jgi:hypothetical protein
MALPAGVGPGLRGRAAGPGATTPRTAFLSCALAFAGSWAPALHAADAGVPAQPKDLPTRSPAVWVGRFGAGLSPWQPVRMNDRIAPNVVVTRRWDGVDAVEVRSNASMSLLVRSVDVDLARTPILCWRWRIDHPLARADLRTRAGDDYAARVYVALRIPEARQGMALRARLGLARAIWGPSLPDAAVNYVWDNRNPVGTEAPNAYTDRAVMVVRRSGAADAGAWVWERQDVGRDVARLWGADARLAQVAVTADTDDTGESVRAGFADLHFVADGAACVTPP